MFFWFVFFDVNFSGCDLCLKKMCVFNNLLIIIFKIFILSLKIKGLFVVKGLFICMLVKKFLFVFEKGFFGIIFKCIEYLI